MRQLFAQRRRQRATFVRSSRHASNFQFLQMSQTANALVPCANGQAQSANFDLSLYVAPCQHKNQNCLILVRLSLLARLCNTLLLMILQVRATAPAPDGGSPVQPDCGTARQPQQQGQHFYNIYMNDSSKNIQGQIVAQWLMPQHYGFESRSQVKMLTNSVVQKL